MSMIYLIGPPSAPGTILARANTGEVVADAVNYQEHIAADIEGRRCRCRWCEAEREQRARRMPERRNGRT